MEPSTAHSSDLELGCNLLCIKTGQIENGKRAGLKEAKHSASCPVVCIYLVMTIRWEMTRIIWRVLRKSFMWNFLCAIEEWQHHAWVGSKLPGASSGYFIPNLLLFSPYGNPFSPWRQSSMGKLLLGRSCHPQPWRFWKSDWMNLWAAQSDPIADATLSKARKLVRSLPFQLK